MNDEIKEILRYLKNGAYIPDECKRKYKILHRDEVKKLLDYITNLQEENQHLQEVLDYEEDFNIYLKSRIEKAVEYIKTCYINELQENCILLNKKEVDNLLNILNGDKDE